VVRWPLDIENAARGLASPAALLRRISSMSSTTDSSAPAHPSTEEKLRALEDQLAHELMEDDARQELRDRVLKLRRRLGL
jgi:hypothetical protein